MIQVRQMLVANNKHQIKCPYLMDAEYITIHNTAMDASANNEIKYMIGNSSQISYHYAIDDVEVVQGVLESRNAWHCGDSSVGDGNRKSIGIEICYSKSGGERYNKAEALTIKFVAQLLKERGWGVDRVKTHKHWTEIGVKRGLSRYVKNCPHRILDDNRWGSFIRDIQEELDVLNGKVNLTPTPTKTTEKSHTVEKGETFYSISKKYGIDAEKLQSYNPRVKASDLQVGDVIHLIPVPNSTPEEVQTVSKPIENTKPIEKPKPVVKPKPKPKPTVKKSTLTYKRPLKKGLKGEDVKALQTALNKLSFKVGAVDGSYGAKTEDAVRRFQKVHLPHEVDGLAGKNTINKINSLIK